jgi:hypothetical protein
MNDGISFDNYLHVIHRDPYGVILDEFSIKNQVQNGAINAVAEAFESGSFTEIQSMGIGTGTGQAVSATALASLVSYEAPSASGSGASRVFEATFTATGSWSIEEAGMASAVNCASGLYFYNDAVSVSMTNDDTLTIQWTVTAST